MLFYGLKKVRETLIGIKDLAFSVHHILLEIVSNGLGCAEIFHGIGNGHPRFLTHSEIMVHCIAAGKDHCRMVENSDPLFSEFPGRNGLNVDKGAKIDVEIEFPGQIKIRRLLGSRLGLGNQNILYCQWSGLFERGWSYFSLYHSILETKTLIRTTKGTNSRVQRYKNK